MKDSELAAAQQRLAEARTAPAKPAAAVGTSPPAQDAQATQATQPVPDSQSDTHSMLPWLWGSLAVLGVGLLTWLLIQRRRAPVMPAARRNFDSEAMAASMRGQVAEGPAESEATVGIVDVRAQTAAEDRVIDLADIPATPAPRLETPTWHSGRWLKSEPEPQAPASAAPRFVPPEDEPPVPEAPSPVMTVAGVTAPLPPSAEQRMRLARAFLDIGDEHSATQLLRDLVVDPDPAARAEAAKLLRELD